MFWTNAAKDSPSIERCFIDGSQRQKVVTAHLRQLRDIAVDMYGNRIYWTDGDLRRIESANLDGMSFPSIFLVGKKHLNFYFNSRLFFTGSDRRVVIDESVIDPIALVVQDDYLYWADLGHQAIVRVDKITGRNRQFVIEDVKHLSSLTALVKINHLEDNPCLDEGCSHLCYIDPKVSIEA